MEDINKLFHLTDTYPSELEKMTDEFLLKLRAILWGQAVVLLNKEEAKVLPAASPQQTKKRAKRLSLLTEGNEVEDELENPTDDVQSGKISPNKDSKRSTTELVAIDKLIEDASIATETEDAVAIQRTEFENFVVTNTETEATTLLEVLNRSEGTNLMPPPSTPFNSSNEMHNKRPQRAAKIKSEKNLKEPKLNAKLRRPTNEIKVKLENEQRVSQINKKKSNNSKHSAALIELNENDSVKSSLSSEKSNDSVFIVPRKESSIVSLTSDVDDRISPDADSNKQQQHTKEQNKKCDSADNETRKLCVKVKREKVSLENQENLKPQATDEGVFKLPAPIPLHKSETTLVEETSSAGSILSTTSNTTTSAQPKKVRKKKDVIHKPIKVERFSDLDSKQAPVSSRTRNGITNNSDNVENMFEKETKRSASIYEDAVQTATISKKKEINMATETVGVVNETVTLGSTADATINLGPVPNDATFCTNQAQTTFQVEPGQTTFVMDSNPNATITLNKDSRSEPLADDTFDVHQVSKTDKDKEDDIAGQRSFETAKDFSSPNDNSLLTEDEQEKPTVTKSKVSSANNKVKGTVKTSGSAKAVYKMTTRTKELFNPLAQSPVKMRVEAFENAAAAATEQSKRPLRNKKDIISSSTSTTPVIGKLAAPALGRFLTPTQSSNTFSANSAVAKKATTSASKVLPMPKSTCSSSLQRSNSSSSAKTLQRENSVDDFRKGLHSLAEERKKQREQKHLLAAQQREAKERERVERMAKLAKERDEKRKLKKQQEQEQRKRELEEIQRKLRQQKEEDEEAAKLKAIKEREMLQFKQQQQLAKHKMLPPPPKPTSKYIFEMLHEDDSTDDEDKVSYKRPPPPTWSRSHVRGPSMLKQEYTPSAYIDSFFSVQPMTPDLRLIFPNIDARHLKRNSSVLWSTPPRYSELPKY